MPVRDRLNKEMVCARRLYLPMPKMGFEAEIRKAQARPLEIRQLGARAP